MILKVISYEPGFFFKFKHSRLYANPADGLSGHDCRGSVRKASCMKPEPSDVNE